MSRTRTNSSSLPAKKKWSPGFRRAMNPSSIVPMLAPLKYFTWMDASLTMVPTPRRWRLATPVSFTR